jgi:hypothetical protein
LQESLLASASGVTQPGSTCSQKNTAHSNTHSGQHAACCRVS